MKTIAIILLSACACFGEAAWTNSLRPHGDGVMVPFVVNGKTTYTIELPSKPTGPETRAAGDLQKWMREMTGAELPINQPAESAIRIFTDPQLADEEYQIEVKGSTVSLSGGGMRGVINAVYALLEEDIGCRWYSAAEARVPKSPTLKTNVVPRKYSPQLRVRDPMYFWAYDPNWSLYNRTNAQGAKVPEDSGGFIDYGSMFVHTAAALLPADKYFKEHPEYFFLDAAGKRNAAQWCPTDPDVAKIVTENVRAFVKKNPHVEIVSVSKNDSGGDQICHCDRCTKIRNDEGSEMACQLVLVNHVAEEIEKEFPKVAIDTLAYLDTIPVPKTMRPRKNVVIRLCNDSVGAWTKPFTPAEQCSVAKIAEAWATACNRIYIWDYTVNFSHYLAPMPNMDVVASNIRFWVKNHAEGVMLQGAYQGVGERDEMRTWVAAKLMWDPTRDEKALEKDFIDGYYGVAAPAITEYETLLAKTAQDHAGELAAPPGGIRYPMDAKFLSRQFIDQANAIFAKAEKLASDESTLHKVERAKLPILYVQATRGESVDEFERIARREKVQYLAEGGADFEAKLTEFKKLKPIYQVISKGELSGSYQAFPDACRLKNGDILCAFYAGYGHIALPSGDYPKGGRICSVRSSDEGVTWSKPQVLFDDADDNRDSHIAQLDDGSIVCTFFSWRLSGEAIKHSSEFSMKIFSERAQLIGASMVRSKDNGATWDTTAKRIDETYVCSAPVRQLADGTCVLGLYTGDKENKTAWGGTTRSKDRGETWEPVVPIGKDAGIPLDAETDVIQLKNGSLLAALRSNTQNLQFATSNDLGKTWSPVRDSGFKGHCPHFTRLSSGEIILSVRSRPNTAVHISRDDGKTWTGPFVIDNVIGAYPSTVELKDKSVLIVYYSEGVGSEIRALRFRLTADGIEKLAWK